MTIAHGSDTASSRKFYIDERDKVKTYILIEGKDLTYDKLYQSVEGDSLFDDSKNIFIENFFSSVKANTNEYKKIVEYISGVKPNIFLWEGKELTKPQQFVFKNSSIKSFNFPANLFVFLDSIKPGNSPSLNLFKELEKTMETELVFYMIIRQFRLLIYSLDPTYAIEESRSMQPWLKSKLAKQASLFGKHKLLTTYRKLYEIDHKTKFGLTPFSLSSSIDIMLASL